MDKAAKIFFLIIFGFNAFTHAQGYLNVIDITSTSTGFQISNIRKITFSALNDMTITKKDGNPDSVFDINKIKQINFSETLTVLEDFTAPNSIYTYPNPVIDEIHFKGQESILSSQVSIVNMESHVMVKQVRNGILDVSELKAGLYECILQLDNRTINLKFIKN